MPSLHNPDWSQLKLSDFPQFQCLCELCECGCFERSKKPHSTKCKKQPKNASTAFDTTPTQQQQQQQRQQSHHTFDSNSVYREAFKRFHYETSNSPVLQHDPLATTLPKQIKPKPSDYKIGYPTKNDKVSSFTTNKDHFRSWRNCSPSQAAAEHQELASSLIYPTEQRKFLTTNEELLFKNDFRNYQAKPNAINVFDNTFKLNQGRMNLDTVYNNEFDKRKLRNVKREPLITKEQMEGRQQKIVKKIPMDLQTQTMLDYTYDADSFRSASNLNMYHTDLFKSKLRKNLNPKQEDSAAVEYLLNNSSSSPLNQYETSYTLSYRGADNNKSISPELQQRQSPPPQRQLHTSSQPNMMYKKNIRYISTFNNAIVPTLKVIKKMPSKLPPLARSLNDLSDNNERRRNSDDDMMLMDSSTTYRADYKDRGVDVCMAKAYSILQQNNQQKLNQFSLSN